MRTLFKMPESKFLALTPTRPEADLPRNLRFDEFRKLCERLLPAQIAHLDRNAFRQPFLHYVDLSSARHLLRGHRRLHSSGKVWVVDPVRIANLCEWHQFTILAAKGVTVACRKVRERHLVGAANFGIHVVNLAGETVGRKPLGHCVSVQKCAIDALGLRPEHAMKSDGSCGHEQFSFRLLVWWGFGARLVA